MNATKTGNRFSSGGTPDHRRHHLAGAWPQKTSSGGRLTTEDIILLATDHRRRYYLWDAWRQKTSSGGRLTTEDVTSVEDASPQKTLHLWMAYDHGRRYHLGDAWPQTTLTSESLLTTEDVIIWGRYAWPQRCDFIKLCHIDQINNTFIELIHSELRMKTILRLVSY